MRVALALTLIAGLAFLTSACGAAQPAAANPASAPRAITVTATEMAFSPKTLELTAGQPVALTLKNTGVVEHSWQIALGGETILVSVQPGQSATKTFTPATPGTYKFVCTVPGHEPAGMVGTLTVK